MATVICEGYRLLNTYIYLFWRLLELGTIRIPIRLGRKNTSWEEISVSFDKFSLQLFSCTPNGKEAGCMHSIWFHLLDRNEFRYTQVVDITEHLTGCAYVGETEKAEEAHFVDIVEDGWCPCSCEHRERGFHNYRALLQELTYVCIYIYIYSIFFLLIDVLVHLKIYRKINLLDWFDLKDIVSYLKKIIIHFYSLFVFWG